LRKIFKGRGRKIILKGGKELSKEGEKKSLILMDGAT